MAVPNGMYDMKIVAGAGGTQAAQNFSVEGVPTRQTQAQTTAVTGWSEESITVVVTDGRLTITASPGSSICFLQITGR
jgi:HSP20 family molecular chaperone IbpA